MEFQNVNLRKDILYEIQNNKPLKEMHHKWQTVRNQCTKIPQDASEIKQKIIIENKTDSCGNTNFSKNNYKEYDLRLSPTLAGTKLSAEITQQAGKDTLSNFLKNGISNFGIDLFAGSVQQNLALLLRLQEAALEESQKLGFTIPLTIYLKLSPRLQYTGRLKSNKLSFKLKLHSRIILTTNREYASCSSKRLIFVNAKFFITYLDKCDIICLGETIQLKVLKIIDDQILCVVITPGIVVSHLPVKFPLKLQWLYTQVSAEELEDIAFAVGTNLNVLVSYAPGCPYDNELLRKILFEFKCENYYLFTRVTLLNLKNENDVKWIASAYDGFYIDCASEPPENKIVKLSPLARKFMLKVYSKMKPIFLCNFWSIFIHPSDYCFAFYYPDKIVFRCNFQYLHLFEAIFNKLALEKYSENLLRNRSLTESNRIAKSIAAASYDFRADAIIICTVVGQMAAKIAHFRPITPIIAVTNIKSVINYAQMHHNVWMVLFEMNRETKGLHKKDIHQKLVYGVRYAMLKNIINNQSTIILVYRELSNYGFTDKFVVIKFDTNYDETIKTAIFQK